MLQYQTSLALDGATLHVNESAPAIGGEQLEKLVNDYRKVQELIVRLSRRAPEVVLNELIYQPELTLQALTDQGLVNGWIDAINQSLENSNTNGTQYSLDAVFSEERNCYLPRVKVRQHGIEREFPISYDFFASGEYRSIVELGKGIANLIEEGGYVKRGEKTKTVDSFAEALEWLMNESKRGLYVQRYKGLGEMNPEQLWKPPWIRKPAACCGDH
ncbi:hypothetical protein MBH78_06330 [Oceanimonas sp. NS1]|nr:hypothetical protein [Oceanimonas sp. NS1]